MRAEVSNASALFERAKAHAELHGRPVLASATVPSNPFDPISVFTDAVNIESRALWLRPATGEAVVAIGAAHSLTGFGNQRFRQLSAAWRELVDDALIDTDAPVGPLLVGGFSFDPRRKPTELWDGFPDARMLVPERQLALRAGAAWLTTNLIAEPDTRRKQAPANVAHLRPAHAQLGLASEPWQERIADLARGIREGTLGLEKVVLARAHESQPTRSLGAALRTLARDYPSCTIFAFAYRDACFLGASPERLISLHHGAATTMALAGSAPRGTTPEADQRIADRLLGDHKERLEHALVVAALRGALDEVCTRVVVDAEPRVHKLTNVQHLLTAIRGQVEPGRSVLDLVEQLHPTPAVGGLPGARAAEIIRDCEDLDRGWYAGPIGWMDVKGDGEFVVGLRSGLVRQDRATLFAGCGIVGESDPATEYAEWGWKLRPMLGALGIHG
jgi:isochorismate synthase